MQQIKKITKKLPYKHIHISCVSGIGMSAIARVLIELGKELGYTITGSDKNQNPNPPIQGMIWTTEEELPEETECLIVSSIMKDTHPQIKLAKERNIPILHRTDAILEIFKDRQIINITGSHGKTSTTCILSHIMQGAAMILGSIDLARYTNGYMGDQASKNYNYLVLEGDESDRTFAKFPAKACIVLTLDGEHLENYHDSEEFLVQYVDEYLDSLPEPHLVFLNTDDTNLRNIYEKALARGKRYTSFAMQADADYKVLNAEFTSDGMIGSIRTPNHGDIMDIKLNIHGEHFFLNCTAAIGLALELGLEPEEIKTNLLTFKGAKKRFNKLGEWNGISFFDDYGNHPREFNAVISTLHKIKAKSDSKIVLIVEPHKYTRLRDHWDGIIETLTQADKIYLLPIFSAGQDPISGVSNEDFVKANSKFIIVDDLEKEIRELYNSGYLTPGDIVLCFGSGHSSDIIRNLFEKIHI